MPSNNLLTFAITTGLGKGNFSEPEPNHKVFVTADYLFFEGESILGGKVCHLSDLPRMKHYHYVEREDKRQVLDLQPRYAGVQRGWSSAGAKLLSRKVVREITFLGYEGVHIKEMEQRPHPFGGSRPPVASLWKLAPVKSRSWTPCPCKPGCIFPFTKSGKTRIIPIY